MDIAAGPTPRQVVAVATTAGSRRARAGTAVGAVGPSCGWHGRQVVARAQAGTSVEVVTQAGTARRPPAAVGARVAMAAPPPGVSVIAHVDRGPRKVEEIDAVARKDGEVPGRRDPSHGAEEIVERGEELILPVEQDAAQVGVAIGPVGPEAVGSRLDAQQIVEVDLVGPVVLLLREVQFVSHFVCEVPGTVACLVVAHGAGRQQGRHGQQEGEQQSFHLIRFWPRRRGRRGGCQGKYRQFSVNSPRLPAAKWREPTFLRENGRLFNIRAAPAGWQAGPVLPAGISDC